VALELTLARRSIASKLQKKLKADEADEQKEYKKKQKEARTKAAGDEEAARALQWDDLMFVHQQQMTRLQREAAQTLAARTAPHKKRIEHTRQRHALSTNCRRLLDQHRIAALQVCSPTCPPLHLIVVVVVVVYVLASTQIGSQTYGSHARS
jgi:hypothetical protein